MTLPARVSSANHQEAETKLPFPQSPAVNARADRLAEVMAGDLPLGAKVTYAALVAMGEPQWLDLHAIAAAAGMTMGQARKFVPALERAGLVVRTNRVVRREGVPSIRARYALAVTA